MINIGVISAKTTAKGIFLTIRRMINGKVAFFSSRARLNFVSSGSLMAWLTEMGCAKTEPKCNRTAVSALKLNRIFAVSFAFTDTNSCSFSYARATNEVFFLKSSLVV